jgi:hypothetical protein
LADDRQLTTSDVQPNDVNAGVWRRRSYRRRDNNRCVRTVAGTWRNVTFRKYRRAAQAGSGETNHRVDMPADGFQQHKRVAAA